MTRHQPDIRPLCRAGGCTPATMPLRKARRTPQTERPGPLLRDQLSAGISAARTQRGHQSPGPPPRPDALPMSSRNPDTAAPDPASHQPRSYRKNGGRPADTSRPSQHLISAYLQARPGHAQRFPGRPAPGTLFPPGRLYRPLVTRPHDRPPSLSVTIVVVHAVTSPGDPPGWYLDVEQLLTSPKRAGWPVPYQNSGAQPTGGTRRPRQVAPGSTKLEGQGSQGSVAGARAGTVYHSVPGNFSIEIQFDHSNGAR
jgi:hypothetical protein